MGANKVHLLHERWILFMSLFCKEISGIHFEVQADCGRSILFKGGFLDIYAILGALCGLL